MEHNFPSPITSDKDLKYYEDYLKSCNTESEALQTRKNSSNECKITVESGSPRGNMRMTDTVYLPAFLNTMVGKLVRVESLIGGCLESRVGILMRVGADYIVLKLYRGCSTMICEASSIKYITVIHDNDLNKAGLF